MGCQEEVSFLYWLDLVVRYQPLCRHVLYQVKEIVRWRFYWRHLCLVPQNYLYASFVECILSQTRRPSYGRALCFGHCRRCFIAFLFKNTLFKGEAVPFVMELPNYRLPGFKECESIVVGKGEGFLTKSLYGYFCGNCTCVVPTKL